MDAELAKAAQAIAGQKVPAGPLPAFLPLVASGEPEPVLAVDGSHAVLADTSAAWVVAVRTAALAWPGPRRPVAIHLHATTPGDARRDLDSAYAQAGFEPPRARSAEAFAEALRSLSEAQTALAAIRAAGSRLVLLDGALRGLPRGPQALADSLLRAAEAENVRLVAVAKRSAMDADGTAVVPWLHAVGPAGVWCSEVAPGSFVARLHARASHAFRIDAASAGEVARLVPHCRDAAYAGYPYPLAVAHNEVAITGTEEADLRGRLQAAVRAAGGKAAEARLADFHDVLDRNVPR